MKILAFLPYYPPHIGGLEKYAKELHERLAQRNIHSTIITTRIPIDSPAVEHAHNVTIIRLPALELIYNYPLPKLWLPRTWKMLMSAHQPYSAVISTTRFFTTTLMALLYAKSTHTPWLHIEHGSEFVTSHSRIIAHIARLWDETIGRIAFKLADTVIAPSQSARRFVMRFTSRDIPVIYRGLDYAAIDSIKPADLAKSYNLRPTGCVVAYAGRFIDGKGLFDLLRAIQIAPKGPLLLMIGSGALEEKLKHAVHTQALHGQVVFLGQKTFSETISIMKASHIIINPSYNEGLPTVILEAAAAARGIIATNVGGTAEIVTANKSALLVSPGRPSELAAAICRLASNPQERRRLGSKARREVKQRFNWDTAADKYLNLLKKYE